MSDTEPAFEELSVEEILAVLRMGGQFYGKVHIYADDEKEIHLAITVYPDDWEEYGYSEDTGLDALEPIYDIDEVLPSTLINMAKMFT